MKMLINILILAFMLSGCTRQRDLYVISQPMLLIKSDWDPAHINTSGEGATAMVYPLLSARYLMSNHRQASVILDEDEYDILIFNGYMYSDNDTHLDYIRYRGTDRFNTFEAYVTPVSKGSAFRPKEGEVVVNNPDTLATRSTYDISIDGKSRFEMKYKNGGHSLPTTSNYVEDSILFIPCRVVHRCLVKVHALNAKVLDGRGIVKGSLRGFAGSVFLANRMPGHENVTHQFNINHLQFDEGSDNNGTIYALFSTFGPPFDLPERKYELEINVKYPSGRETQVVFDITDQIKPQIERMIQERFINKPIMDDIVVAVEIELDNDSKGDFEVGFEQWGNDLVISVPMKL